MFFEDLRSFPIKLAEIGIDSGASMRMWRKYFFNQDAEIHGCDIREGYEYLHKEGIKTHLMDQSNEADLIMFGIQNEDFFDIICVDGSHNAEDDRLTFDTLFL